MEELSSAVACGKSNSYIISTVKKGKSGFPSHYIYMGVTQRARCLLLKSSEVSSHLAIFSFFRFHSPLSGHGFGTGDSRACLVSRVVQGGLGSE